MSDDKPDTFLGRVQRHAKTAMVAGALASTGGCSSNAPAPQDAPTEAVPPSVPNAPDIIISSENLYRMAFNENALETYVIVDGQRIRLINPSAQDTRQWNDLVRGERSFSEVAVEFVDPTGILETCTGEIAVPEEYRNTKYLPGLITNESLETNLLILARHCEVEHPTAAVPQEAVVPPEPVDPRTIVSREGAPALHGRVEDAGVQRHA